MSLSPFFNVVVPGSIIRCLSFSNVACEVGIKGSDGDFNGVPGLAGAAFCSATGFSWFGWELSLFFAGTGCVRGVDFGALPPSLSTFLPVFSFRSFSGENFAKLIHGSPVSSLQALQKRKSRIVRFFMNKSNRESCVNPLFNLHYNSIFTCKNSWIFL